MMRLTVSIVLLLLSFITASSQRNEILDADIRTLQVQRNGRAIASSP